MGRSRLRLVGLLAAVAIVAGAATAFGDLTSDFSSPAAPVPGGTGSRIYLQMTGSLTGKFTGGVKVRGYTGAIDVLALDFSSTPTGQAPCNPIEFREPTDQQTPPILASTFRNETITAVFNEVHVTTKTTDLMFKVTASNAKITSIHHVDSTTTGAYEDVTLTPTKVAVEWVPTKHITQYLCSAT
jgi:type VI protein secretion system component Hcp